MSNVKRYNQQTLEGCHYLKAKGRAEEATGDLLLLQITLSVIIYVFPTSSANLLMRVRRRA